MQSNPFQGGLAPRTLVDLLEQRAEQDGAACVYTYLLDGEHDARSLTCGELDRRARALAAMLGSRVKMGERALVLLPPGLDFIAAFFGCLYAGTIAVPAPLPQRKGGLSRIMAILRDCGPVIALSTSDVIASVGAASHDAELALQTGLHWIAVDQVADGAEDSWRRPDVAESSLAFLQYTSGSTGVPRGVALTHGNLLRNEHVIQRAFGLTHESVIVGWLPPYHDMGLIGNILQPLYAGGMYVQMAPEHFLRKPARWLSAISRYRGTTSGGPNFAYDLCVARIAPEERAGLDLRSWTVAFNGAEPVRAATLDRFAAAFASAGFQRSAFYPCYGLAEATLFVTGGLPDAPPVVRTVERVALEQGRAVFCDDRESALALVGSGRPGDGVEVQVVHPETRLPCAAGEVGEIWVNDASVARGYWERPEETTQTFGARLATGEGPYLRTGDLGFLGDGELYVVGRLKDLIIIRGRNLHPQDIELTAEGSHPGLRAGGCAAFSIDVAGEERLVVVHEIAGQATLDLEEVGAAVRRVIAHQHEVAVHVVAFIRPGSLPRTTSGKVRRRACRAQFLDGSLGAIGQSLPGSSATATAGAESDAGPGGGAGAGERPRTQVEIALSAVWMEVLGCQRVGLDDDFLELGGDSLKATQVSARVLETCGVEISPAQLLDSTTVAALAAVIEQQTRAPVGGRVAAEGRRHDRAPLSFVQERLWFLDQLAAGAPVYHVAVAIRLAGALDARALEQAVTALVARHDALRTRFPAPGGQPIQDVLAPAPVALERVAVDAAPEAQRAAALDDAVREQARRPFELADAPPVRWTLIRAGEREHVLAVTCHHLVADGWSATVLLRELAELYRAFVEDRPATLAAPSLSYTDYAVWQRGRAPDDDDGAIAYWRARLERHVPPLALPGDRPRTPVQTYAGAREELALDPGVVAGLGALGRRAGTTLFTTVLTGLVALLHRYTGQRDLCIGVPAAARTRVAFEQVVGCFLNTFALRIDASGNPSVGDLLARVHRAVAEAHAHQEVPFERVLEALRLSRDLGHTPLFQVMFSMPPPLPAPDIPGLALTVAQVDTGAAQFDLALDLVVDRGAARVVWEYSTDLFEASTIRRLGGHLQRVLEGMVGDPGARLSELALLGEDERSSALGACEQVQPPRSCVHALFEARAAATPEAIAVIDGESRMTYAAVNARANQLAHRLRELGVGPETRVAIGLHRGADLVASVLAVLKAGGAYVPLDPLHPADRLGLMMVDAGPSVVVTRGAPGARLPATRAIVLDLDREAEVIARAPATDPAPAGALDGLAYVLYTSGSTGQPKGVMVTHRTLASAFAAWSSVYRLPPEEVRLLQLASPAFDVWTADWVRALLSGGTLVVAPAEVALDPAAISALIRRERVTIVDLVPALIRPLMELWDRARGDAESLRLLIVGSEAWPVDDYVALRERCAPHTRLLSCYGVTEATIDSAWFEGALDAGATRPVPLGGPFPNTRLYVLDRHGQPVPAGVPGELAIGGGGVARGYWGRPRLSAERFVPDPHSGEPGARLYRTGDRARRRSDGTLEFLGRIDDQLKVRGMRIEAGEIEARLLRHPGIRDAAVACKEVGGHTKLLAYCVAVGRTPSDPELKELLRAHLPEAAIPSAFVWLDSLPRNPNGKLDRRALPEVEASFDRGSAAVQAPRSELERAIAAIWCDALAVREVSIHDNFFDLGGHSLLLARVRNGLCERLGREVAMLALFQYPTIASLAEALGEGGAEPARPTESEREQPRAARARRAELFARRRADQEPKP